MRNYFILDGVDSRDFGIYISGQGVFGAPARSYDLVQVKGRNGDLINDYGNFDTGTFTYPAFICRNFRQNIADFRAFLLSRRGYKRLTDSYNPDEFRQVIFSGDFAPDVTPRNDAANFDIVFRAKPQRFLTSGEASVVAASGLVLQNPTRFHALPLIVTNGTGYFSVENSEGTVTVTIAPGAGGGVTVDCEMMDAYSGSANKNNFVSLSGYKFPTLAPGANRIRCGSGITRLTITPRWWTL